MDKMDAELTIVMVYYKYLNNASVIVLLKTVTRATGLSVALRSAAIKISQ